MATKKKVATKVVHKKAAHTKKVEPAKKTAKPVSNLATSKPLLKSIGKPFEKKVIASETSSKKVPLPVVKQTEKPVEKVSGSVSKNANPPKTEQEKNTPKILENKPKENNVNQPATPPPAKPAQKKEVPAKPAKVVMPDIKTKTVRKYEPDFTKSVLDTPAQDQSLPSQRYSDTDLSEFRELINKKLDAAKKELNYLQGLITRKDEMGGDESDNRYMTMEDGSISMEREQLSQMASRQITFIDHLEKAIMRIENKTYGICRVTGKLIDKARLRAVPHATLSIEAKQTMNK